MRIEEGANTKDNEEYRESVRLEVRQGNGIINRRVEGLQDGILEVSTLDRIDAKNLRSSKAHRYHSGKLTAKLHLHSRDWLVRTPYRGTGCIG
jgi:hypothetical protein